MLDTKSYIRLNRHGEPQLVRVGPYIEDGGVVNRELVAMYLDEEGPHILPREAAKAMVTDCVLVDEMLHWKAKIH